MNEIKWSNRFNLGVDMIDKAHQKLFSIVGKLISLNEDIEKQQHACREGIKYLKNYTVKHFAEEEAYMSYINYNGYEMHKKLHADMRDNTLPALEKELNRQNYSVESVRHFLGICIGWLNTHVMIEDHAITGRTVNKWIHDSSDDVTASLEKAVIQVSQDMFRLKAQIVSEHYSGEDFSSGQLLCYRLTYLSPKQERTQVYLIYEKKLVLRVLGEMLGKAIKSTDKTIAYAVKILTQHFVERIGAHFAPQNANTLEKNDILTFEQFLTAVDKAYPPYSLLFNTTGKGYFALCINY